MVIVDNSNMKILFLLITLLLSCQRTFIHYESYINNLCVSNDIYVSTKNACGSECSKCESVSSNKLDLRLVIVYPKDVLIDKCKCIGYVYVYQK